MNSPLLNWWGFRLRIPTDYRPKPLGLSESVASFLLMAAGLELLWLGRLLILPPEQPGTFGYEQFITPLMLTLVPVVAGLLASHPILAWARATPWLLLARAKGEMKRLDLYMAALGVLSCFLIPWRLSSPLRATAMLMAVDTALVLLTLAVFQERVDFSKRRWKIEIPDWLRQTVSDEERKKKELGKDVEQDEVIPAEAGAAPVYVFSAPGETSHSVGICIPDAVLQQLREINAKYHGCLYQKQPLPAVLVDRAPAHNIGREELKRLCAQVLSIARKHGLTRMQFANTVLAFVQTAIRYEFDQNSTVGYPGGPYTEYGRFALETVHDSVGDCECTTILCASLLAYLGFQTALLRVVVTLTEALPLCGLQAGDRCLHLAVGLEASSALITETSIAEGFDCIDATDGSGGKYLYGETACEGHAMAFGSVPPEWKDTLEVQRVDSIPVPAS